MAKLEAEILVKMVVHNVELHLQQAAAENIASDDAEHDYMEEALRAYFVILDLAQFDVVGGDFSEQLDMLKASHPWVYHQVDTQCLSVEIKQGSHCFLIHFKVNSECGKLMNNDVFTNRLNEYIENIPRDNPEEKAYTLLVNMRKLLVEAEHLTALIDHPQYSQFIKNQRLMMSIPFNLSLLIVFVLILFYGGVQNPWHGYSVMAHITKALTAVHVLATACQTSCYFIIEAPMLAPQNFEAVAEDDSAVALDAASKENSHSSGSQWPFHRPYSLPETPLPIARSKHNATIAAAQYVLSGGSLEPIYYLFILLLSVLGVNQPFYHAVVLVEFFRTEQGLMVLKACKVGAPKLAKTFLMGIIMILAWTCIGWLFFWDPINRSEFCRTIWQCTLRALQVGLRGDIGDMHSDEHGNVDPTTPFPEAFDNEVKFQAELLFVLLFYVMWEFVLAGIIQGQIIDSFAEIRAYDDAMDLDSVSNCMICSLNRFEIESFGCSFFRHIEKQHNPKHYFFFFAQLMSKDNDDYTGPEGYVREHLDRSDIAFLPVGTCIEQNGSKDAEPKFSELVDAVDEINNRAVEQLDNANEALSMKFEKLTATVEQMSRQLASLRDAIQVNQ
jgi:hypothetical protein